MQATPGPSASITGRHSVAESGLPCSSSTGRPSPLRRMRVVRGMLRSSRRCSMTMAQVLPAEEGLTPMIHTVCMSKRRTQVQRSEATRQALLGAARRLFERRGFDDVAAEEIVTEARVTRGALYHHFEDGKPGLFRAVVREAMEEVHTRLAAEGRRARTPLEALELGMSAFLRIC